jgi:hypothetical protein
VFRLLYDLVHVIEPILVPLCFLLAWTLIFVLGWTLGCAIRDTANRAKLMHEIPCTNCQFFTNDHRLKCTVNPVIANTEKAIDCSDYSPRSSIG